MQYIGLSKVASCQRKSLPTWLVLASYSAWHFFTDSDFYIKYPKTTQPSTSKLSDNPEYIADIVLALNYIWSTSYIKKKLNHLSPNIQLKILHTHLRTLP